MPVPGQKKERIWHDPPMPDEQPQTQPSGELVGLPDTTISVPALQQMVQHYAYEQTKANLYLVVAFYAMFYAIFWYALVKYLAPGATPEDILAASLVIPIVNGMYWLLLRIKAIR